MAGGAVTVIDYFSHYLLAIHLTASYAAVEINKAIDQARARAEATHKPHYRMQLTSPLLGDRALELNVRFTPYFVGCTFRCGRLAGKRPTTRADGLEGRGIRRRQERRRDAAGSSWQNQAVLRPPNPRR